MKSPMMMDGALKSTSLMKRITVLKYDLRPYSAKYVPARTPMGDPIRIPRSVMTALPYKALSKPPRPPCGGVDWVNRCQDMPARPRDTKVHSIAARHASPIHV